jgi:hypothetical protein
MKVLVTSKRLAGYAPRLADLEPPTNSERVPATLRGIRVLWAPHRPAKPCPGRYGQRHGACHFRWPLLLLGFAGALRRLELVALAWPIHPGFLVRRRSCQRCNVMANAATQLHRHR